MDTDKRYLIDVFDVVNCFRKEINECLKAMGFEPLPLNITTYPEVINHLEKVKAVIENRGKDLKSEQSILAEYKEKELTAKLQCTNSVACRASCPRICRAGWPFELAEELAECRA